MMMHCARCAALRCKHSAYKLPNAGIYQGIPLSVPRPHPRGEGLDCFLQRIFQPPIYIADNDCNTENQLSVCNSEPLELCKISKFGQCITLSLRLKYLFLLLQ